MSDDDDYPMKLISPGTWVVPGIHGALYPADTADQVDEALAGLARGHPDRRRLREASQIIRLADEWERAGG